MRTYYETRHEMKGKVDCKANDSKQDRIYKIRAGSHDLPRSTGVQASQF